MVAKMIFLFQGGVFSGFILIFRGVVVQHQWMVALYAKKNQCLSFGRFWGRQKDACFFKDAIQPCFGLISPHIGGEWGSGSRFCHVKKDKDKDAKDKDRGKGDKEKGNRLENRFYSNKSCEQWTCNIFLKGTFGDFNYCGDHFINHGMRNPM